MSYYSIEKLELPKILAKLIDFCDSPLGRDLVRDLSPSNNIDEILLWQRETQEAKDCLRLYPTFTLGGIRDIRSHLWRVERNATLNPTELTDILDTLQANRRLRKFFSNIKEDLLQLKEVASGLVDLEELEREISSNIGEDGKIRDDASPELLRLRQRINSIQEGIKNRLDTIIRSGEYQKMLRETLITVRGDRYVLPIKQEYRGRFPGLVHDQSASGATLFIEPMSVVELNNDLRRFQLEERREIELILARLSEKIKDNEPEMQISLSGLARLDFIFAKARLSMDMDGASPKYNQTGFLQIVKGRHPLIKGTVVPLDIKLGGDFQTLIITGPNTGGKTVALKTTGLLCLMAQCGLHIPAEPETELCIFEQIFADIGDEQSIEQSLSTFSSHMKNLVGIVKAAGQGSLVLLDELGAGTDPVEGSALAMAILHQLHHKGARIVATTHYSELKAFAYSTKGIENASVEFDPVTLQPTYRLLIGMPGRSNALEIASRLGLEKEVVELARSFVSEDELEVGALIEDLETRRQSLAKGQDEAKELQAELLSLRQQLAAEREALRTKEEEILEKARIRAKKIVDESQTTMNAIIAQIREAAKVRQRAEQNKAIEESRQKLQQLKQKNRARLKAVSDEYKKNAPATVSPGETVYVTSLKQKGTVLGSPNNQGEVQVQVGILKAQVSLTDLRQITEETSVAGSASVAKLVMEKSHEMTQELDLRGLTVDEALEATEKYLDDALLSNLSTVYLIHGKGTGALRAAIGERLRNEPGIKNYRLGGVGEGGSGVTVVELRK